MSDAPADPPSEVVALARDRASARTARDFDKADELRDRLADLGWAVRDGAGGFDLSPLPDFTVVDHLSELPDASLVPDTHRCSVLLVVDGWPADVSRCVEALLTHTSSVIIQLLEVGDRDGCAALVHSLARSNAGRVIEWHVRGTVGDIGWGPCVSALSMADTATYQVLMDVSTVLDGDALTSLVEAFDDPTVVASGWRGVNADLADDWRSFVDAPVGEVDAVLGYLMAVPRAAMLNVGGPSPRARYYRNADIELCLTLRQSGGRIVVPPGPFPVHQERHRGYHDTAADVRDRESRRTYDRLLKAFRGREDLLAPRA